jgi:hypothetical protein
LDEAELKSFREKCQFLPPRFWPLPPAGFLGKPELLGVVNYGKNE